MIWLLFVVPAAYQLVALIACIRHLLRREAEAASYPPVSILKPIHRKTPRVEAAIATNRAQDYPAFEVLAETARTTRTPNRKVGALIELARAASHPVLVVSDADIAVPHDYLRRVVAPLAEPGVGLVTCLYRATGETFPAQWEALGVATDFAPSTLVAPLAGINEFAMGSTLAFRAADLQRAGGFESIADYIADDYQLGRRIAALGLKVRMSKVVVETHLEGRSMGDVWRHQLRWARTIRLSRGAYAGLPVTNASFWAVLLVAAGQHTLAVALVFLRLLVGLAAGWAILRSRVVLRWWFLMPARDLWGLAVWTAAMTGNTVVWSGERMSLDRHGRIVHIE
ncbi:MAG TPA: glycosyltransferase [Bryobacteraceae bacterium]|nr:glycosyltransferase [Bryobacteraceae bacterium]